MKRITKREQGHMLNWVELLEFGGAEAVAVLGDQAQPLAPADRSCLFCGEYMRMSWKYSDETHWWCDNSHCMYQLSEHCMWRDCAIRAHWPNGIKTEVPKWAIDAQQTQEFTELLDFVKNHDANHAKILYTERWACSSGNAGSKFYLKAFGINVEIRELRGRCAWQIFAARAGDPLKDYGFSTRLDKAFKMAKSRMARLAKESGSLAAEKTEIEMHLKNAGGAINLGVWRWERRLDQINYMLGATHAAEPV